MNIKIRIVWKWIVLLLIFLNCSIYKILGLSYDNYLRLFTSFVAIIAFIYLKRFRFEELKYLRCVFGYVIVMSFIEIIYTILRYESFSIIDVTDTILIALLFTGLSTLIIYLLKTNTFSLICLLKIIVAMTSISYLLRFAIRFVYMKTGRIICTGIAYECASENWTRNGLLRINPPCFAIIIIPILIYLISESKKKCEQLLYALLIAMALYYSYSIHMARSMFLYQLITLIFYFIFMKKRSIKSLITICCVFIAIVVLYNLDYLNPIFEMINSIFNTTSNNAYGDTTSARLYALNFFFSWMKSNWLLGIGALSNSQLTIGLYTGHISDLGLLGNLFRFGILGFILELITIGRMFWVSFRLYVRYKSYDPLVSLAIGISVSTLLVSINIDCFYFLFAFAFPFSMGIVEWIYYKIRKKKNILDMKVIGKKNE